MLRGDHARDFVRGWKAHHLSLGSVLSKRDHALKHKHATGLLLRYSTYVIPHTHHA
jgi:hypothetical protein